MAKGSRVILVDEGSLPTSPTLLAKIRLRAPGSWDRFVRLYTPLVYSWCRHARLRPPDAEEVGQEVFLRVASRLHQYEEKPGGSFRGWMWRITQRKILDYRRRRVHWAAGGDTPTRLLQEIPDDAKRDDDQETIEADMNILYRRALVLMEESFEPNTRRAFWLMIDGRTALEVATELGMTTGAVYTAKSKILKRLRSEFGDLMDLDGPGSE